VLWGFHGESLAQWLPEAVRLANQVKAAETWPKAVFWFSLDVIIRSTGFQASKVGDMVCVRGPSPHSPAKPRRDAAQMAAVRPAR